MLLMYTTDQYSSFIEQIRYDINYILWHNEGVLFDTGNKFRVSLLIVSLHSKNPLKCYSCVNICKLGVNE